MYLLRWLTVDCVTVCEARLHEVRALVHTTKNVFAGERRASISNSPGQTEVQQRSERLGLALTSQQRQRLLYPETLHPH